MPTDRIRDGIFSGGARLSPLVYIFWHLCPTTRHVLLFPNHPPSAPRSVTVILGMGRRPWSTSEQLTYLKSFVHLLPQARSTSGLETLYAQVYDGFLTKWAAEPVVRKPDESPEAHEARSKARLRTVRPAPPPSTFSHSRSASVSATGIKKSERRPNAQPPHTPIQHLASLTYLASRSARGPPTNSTRHSPFFTGDHRIPHSVSKSKASGSGGMKIPSTKSSSCSSKRPSRPQHRPRRSWYSTWQ